MAQLKALYPEVELPKRDINDIEGLALLNKRNKVSSVCFYAACRVVKIV
jgi:hypothetical protein